MDYLLSKLEEENHLLSIGSSSTFVKRPVGALMKEIKIKVTELFQFDYQDESILQALSENSFK